METNNNLKISEIEYQELGSSGFKNYKVGIRCLTTPETYEEDFAALVIEVKSRLHKVIEMNKKKPSKKKK